MAAAEQPPVDVEFFLDPVCPWCWITSRWVTNVQAETDYVVDWRFISLYVLNEDKEPSEQMRQAHLGGLRCLRVLDQVRHGPRQRRRRRALHRARHADPRRAPA